MWNLRILVIIFTFQLSFAASLNTPTINFDSHARFSTGSSDRIQTELLQADFPDVNAIPEITALEPDPDTTIKTLDLGDYIKELNGKPNHDIAVIALGLENFSGPEHLEYRIALFEELQKLRSAEKSLLVRDLVFQEISRSIAEEIDQTLKLRLSDLTKELLIRNSANEQEALDEFAQAVSSRHWGPLTEDPPRPLDPTPVIANQES